jgi:hypothetical protein
MVSNDKILLLSALRDGLGLDQLSLAVNDRCWSIRECYLQAFLYDTPAESIPLSYFSLTHTLPESLPIYPDLPILMVVPSAEEAPTVLDGRHRLALFLRNKKESILAYVLTPAQADCALCSFDVPSSELRQKYNLLV